MPIATAASTELRRAPALANRARAGAGLLAIGLGLLVARSAGADEADPISLTWDAPDGCPGRASVLDDIHRLLGPHAHAKEVRARAVVRPGAGGDWTLALSLEGAAVGVRTLTGPSCSKLARAAALLVSLAIDPTASAQADREELGGVRDDAVGPPPSAAPAAPAPAPAPAPALAPALAPAPASAPAPAPAPASALSHAPPPATHWFASAGGSAEHGLVPGLALGGWLGAGFSRSSWRAETRITGLPTVTAESARAGARVTEGSLDARGCVRAPSLPVALYGCAGLRGSWLLAEGERADVTYRPSEFVPAALLGIAASWPVARRVSVEASVDGDVPFSRPRVVVDDAGTLDVIYEPPVIGISARVGVALGL